MGLSKKEAVEKFVERDLNSIDASIIHDLVGSGVGNFRDITPYDPEDEDDIPPCDWDYGLPMWGTMWSFDYDSDAAWARENLKKIKDCGFTILDSDYGLFIGIDGAGYDFYEKHWTPLYDAFGFKWHTN